jgi:hypothetical protein
MGNYVTGSLWMQAYAKTSRLDIDERISRRVIPLNDNRAFWANDRPPVNYNLVNKVPAGLLKGGRPIGTHTRGGRSLQITVGFLVGLQACNTDPTARQLENR